MKKITVKNLVEFRKKSDKSKIIFINNLKVEKVKSDVDSGGDYWISCLWAIRNTFTSGDLSLLDKKIDLLNDKIKVSKINRIKNQFRRNIDIINNFKDYDFQYLKPMGLVTFLKQIKNQTILDIKKIPIESKPCHIFSFSQNNSDEIGGVWFVAQLNGFTKNELGMFTEILYRYLNIHYSKEFYVNQDYCIAVDLYSGQKANYTEIQKGTIPKLIDITLDNLKKFY